MELFVIIVNGFEPLTIITKCSILKNIKILANRYAGTFSLVIEIYVISITFYFRFRLALQIYDNTSCFIF